MMDTATAPAPKPGPLFVLDLGANGGTFAPTSLDELTQWIEVEVQFWEWLWRQQFGNHEGMLRAAIGQLHEAQRCAAEARGYPEDHPTRGQQLEACRNHLARAFSQDGLPHSATPLAKRIDQLRAEAGDRAASFFAAVFVPPPPGHNFHPAELDAWRGLVEGIVDRFGLPAEAQQQRLRALEDTLKNLATDSQRAMGEKQSAIEALHRQYQELAESIRQTAESHAKQFDTAENERAAAFDKLLQEHEQKVEALRKAFREEMGLRAPAEYWEEKRKKHKALAWVTGILSFCALAAAAVVMTWQVQELWRTNASDALPATWRLALLALVAVFLVWGVRLVVRMFLSHLHLLTDAAERVVMVKTYLSLLEGDRLTSREDRQLILQALFRPAADGIVKDEAVPPSVLEWLSRAPK